MSFFRRIIPPNSLIARKGKYILFFSNGFLLALLIYFYTEKQFEHEVFASMATYVKGFPTPIAISDKQANADSLIIRSLHLIHEFGKDRLPVFGDNNIGGIKGGLLQPVTLDLVTAQGACGSHAYMLARLLQELNFDIRIPQMTVSGESAGHIIVEAKTADSWVVLDALSDAYFTRPDGSLAAFDDVKNNWTMYSKQVPANYNMAYRYEGVRYTNWDKIPVIMPLIKNVMYWTMGKEQTDGYSIRSIGLDKYNILFNITLGVYVIILLFTINSFVKEKRKAALLHKVVPGNDASQAVPA